MTPMIRHWRVAGPACIFVAFVATSMAQYIEAGGWLEKPPAGIESLQYPRIALSARVSGLVIVETVISDQGVPSETRILQGHPLLAQDVLRAMPIARFRREQLGAAAPTGPTRAIVVFRFVITKACADSSCPTVVRYEQPGLVSVTSPAMPLSP